MGTSPKGVRQRDAPVSEALRNPSRWSGTQQYHPLKPVGGDGQGCMGRRGAGIDVSGMGHDQGPQSLPGGAAGGLLMSRRDQVVDHPVQFLGRCGIESAGPNRFPNSSTGGTRRDDEASQENGRDPQMKKPVGEHDANLFAFAGWEKTEPSSTCDRSTMAQNNMSSELPETGKETAIPPIDMFNWSFVIHPNRVRKKLSANGKYRVAPRHVANCRCLNRRGGIRTAAAAVLRQARLVHERGDRLEAPPAASNRAGYFLRDRYRSSSLVG